MNAFIKFLYEILKQFFGGIWRAISNVFIGIFEMINLDAYFKLFSEYGSGFKFLGWVLAILAFLTIIAIFAGMVFLLILGIRKIIILYHSKQDQVALVGEIGRLNKEVSKLTSDKEKLLIRGFANGISLEDEIDTEEENTSVLQEGESRFYKLTQIDNQYIDYDPSLEYFNNDIKLDEICEMFRNFACYKMHLYYDIRIIRLFVAALSSTRLIVLQGISGTGKTSLPYAWGKFLKNDSQIASVQPSWRDRSELYGYFNEFTKRFNETEVLKILYEATYTDKVYTVILDEMNIAKVEYYFAEMLSILEMPSKDEWIIDLVPSGWPDDPKHIKNGRFQLPTNLWYVGTANNDDSTFTISDKVYDRAIPINIDSKGVQFNAPATEQLDLSANHLNDLFNEAIAKNVVSEETLRNLSILDDYVILHFRLAFGNRIVKQLKEFIPTYVACGGTELDGLDYVLANKIFRKFEAMNIAFIRDELDGLVDELHLLFGEDSMGESVAYLKRLKRM